MEEENNNNSAITFTPNYTHKQIFSDVEEEMLEDYIIEASEYTMVFP